MPFYSDHCSFLAIILFGSSLGTLNPVWKFELNPLYNFHSVFHTWVISYQFSQVYLTLYHVSISSIEPEYDFPHSQLRN